MPHRFHCIIFPDDQRCAAGIANALGFGWIGDHVIAGAAFAADPPAGHSALDHAVINLDRNHMVDPYPSCFQGFCLGQCAGHTVQNETVFAIRNTRRHKAAVQVQM